MDVEINLKLQSKCGSVRHSAIADLPINNRKVEQGLGVMQCAYGRSFRQGRVLA